MKHIFINRFWITLWWDCIEIWRFDPRRGCCVRVWGNSGL